MLLNFIPAFQRWCWTTEGSTYGCVGSHSPWLQAGPKNLPSCRIFSSDTWNAFSSGSMFILFILIWPSSCYLWCNMTCYMCRRSSKHFYVFCQSQLLSQLWSLWCTMMIFSSAFHVAMSATTLYQTHTRASSTAYSGSLVLSWQGIVDGQYFCQMIITTRCKDMEHDNHYDNRDNLKFIKSWWSFWWYNWYDNISISIMIYF